MYFAEYRIIFASFFLAASHYWLPLTGGMKYRFFNFHTIFFKFRQYNLDFVFPSNRFALPPFRVSPFKNAQYPNIVHYLAKILPVVS